jgi:hypothetical protein
MQWTRESGCPTHFFSLVVVRHPQTGRFLAVQEVVDMERLFVVLVNVPFAVEKSRSLVGARERFHMLRSNENKGCLAVSSNAATIM